MYSSRIVCEMVRCLLIHVRKTLEREVAYDTCTRLVWKTHIKRFIMTKVEAWHNVIAWLTHWGWVTHICVGNLTIIGSNNALSPRRRQAIIWTSAGILLIGPLGTNFSEILKNWQTTKIWFFGIILCSKMTFKFAFLWLSVFYNMAKTLILSTWIQFAYK